MNGLIAKKIFFKKESIFKLYCIFLLAIVIPHTVNSQIVNLPCQTEIDGFIGLDRKNWNGGSTAFHSEGALHNFDFPTNTFGDCKIITNVDVTITIFNIDVSNLPGDCPAPVDYYINIATGCPSFSPATCDPSNFIYEAPSNPLVSINIPFTNPPDDFQFGDVLSVDIVPVMNTGCSAGQTALSSGGIVIDYQMCVTITVDDAIPSGIVNLGSDVTVCPGATTMIDAGSFDDYLWDPNGETSQMITAGVGTYTVTVTDDVGCTSSDEINVTALPDSDITFDPISPSVCDNGMTMISVNENYSSYVWDNGMMGQSIMISDGMYEVTITDANSCTAVNSITVSNIPPPNAGVDNFIDVCNDGTTYNIDDQLMAHDPGGTWTDVNGVGIDLNINPVSVDFLNILSGSYNFTYTVTGTNPCPSDDATITVNVFDQNNAGMSNTIQECTNPGSLDFYLLLNNPDIGGVWTDLDFLGVDLTNPFAVNFNGIPAGTYNFQYLLLANGPCSEQSEILTIIIQESAFAGLDNQATLCEGTFFDLLSLVNGANGNGTFFDSDGSGALSGSIVNTAGLAGQSFDFSFIVGTIGSPCGQDEAIFTVNIETNLSAGNDAIDEFCIGGNIDLYNLLTNEDQGGTFIDVNFSGGLFGNILTTDNINPGVYSYQYLIGDGITCPQDDAEITLTFFEDPSFNFIPQMVTVCIDNCETVQLDLVGTPPFDFPMEIYSATSGNLIVSTNVNTLNSSHNFSICNNTNGNSYINDTLNLVSDSSWYITIPSLTDANCIFNNNNVFDTLFINTLTNTFYSLDTFACISDTININGVELFAGNSTYMDTLAGIFCDSIVFINVNFLDVDTIPINSILCSGDSILIEGIWFNESFTNTEINIENPNGCDTVLIIDIGFYPSADTLIDIELCTGDSIIVNNTVYNFFNPSGSELLIGQSSNGCDSIVNVSLEFSDDIMLQITDILCASQSITVGGITFNISNPSGQITLFGSGCDTIVDIDLSFYPPTDTIINNTFCADFSITVNGNLYDENNPSGSEVLLGSSQFGCDSIVNIDLSIYPPADTILNETFCPDFSINVNGTVYDFNNRSGTETIQNASQFGCDSIFIVDLEFSAPIVTDYFSDFCDNESINVNGINYDASNISGTEIIIGGAASGCDSTVNVLLNILPTYTINEDTTICEGDSIFLENQWQFSAGTYIDNFQSANMCDSIITTVLTVNPCTVQVFLNSTGNDCANESNGSIAIDIQSVIQFPYTITWNGTNSSISGSQLIETDQGLINISNLISDSYVISIVDSNGNSIYQNSIDLVDNNQSISGNWNVTTPILCANGLGSFEFVTTGGQSPYSYNWNPTTIGDTPIAQDVIAGEYFLTITDINNCNLDTIYTFIEPQSLIATISSDSLSCGDISDGQISITDISGGVSPYTIFINGVLTNSLNFNNLDTGIYLFEISDANDCTINFSEELIATDSPVFGTYNDNYQILEGESVLLEGTMEDGNFSFDWVDSDGSLSCNDCPNPEANPTSTTSYTLLITDDLGCTQLIKVNVEVQIIEVENIFPNIFSPNGDNANDEFVIKIIDGQVLGLTLSIYNRWGNLLFIDQSLGNEIMWDGTENGTLLNAGIYVYKVIVQKEDGSSYVIMRDLLLIN